MTEETLSEERLKILFDRLRETISISIHTFEFERFAKEIFDLGKREGKSQATKEILGEVNNVFYKFESFNELDWSDLVVLKRELKQQIQKLDNQLLKSTNECKISSKSQSQEKQSARLTDERGVKSPPDTKLKEEKKK